MIIISRCPYRISLLGGGSDINWYLKEEGYGMCLGTAFNQYSTIALAKTNSEKGILNYSIREEYSQNTTIAHNLIRETFIAMNVLSKLELTSFGGNINGSGLGGSSSFLVALVGAISNIKNKNFSNEEVAKIAVDIEINKVGSPIGGQDHFMSGLGVGRLLNFKLNEDISNEQNMATKNTEELISQCYLIFSNRNRSAAKIIKEFKEKDSKKNIKNISKIRDLCIEYCNKEIKKNQSIECLINYVKESWRIKKELNGVMNNELEQMENCLIDQNFEVLKLLGAGGGGYFLVRCVEKQFIEKTCYENNLNFIKCEVDTLGLTRMEV